MANTDDEVVYVVVIENVPTTDEEIDVDPTTIVEEE